MREYNYRIQPFLNVCEGLYKLYIYIWADYHTVLENRMYYAFLFRFLSVNLISIGYIHIYPA
jgi:hypothetical protein